MRTRSPSLLVSALALRALACAALCVACAASGPPRPEQVETRDESGFTISEEVRVGSGVRDDFESALLLLEREQYAEGIALLEQVTQAAPHVTAPHVDLAIAYRRIEDLERAQQSLERALALSPRHPVVHNELGIVYRRTGRFDEARRSYEQALALHPDFHYARLNLAILCDLFLHEPECALANYQAYAEAVPDDPNARVWIADLQSRIGK